MKVYNLACPLDHRFEGWFASEEDCLAQQDKGMLACPVCDSTQITRMPSAPHIAKASSTVVTASEDMANVSGEVVALTGNDHSALEAQVQAAFLKGMRELMGKSEDVGAALLKRPERFTIKRRPSAVFVVKLLWMKLNL